MPEQQDWAEEPWEFIAAGEDEPYSKIVAADGKCIACDMDYYPFIETECMPRIAACVSACTGVPTKYLEQVPEAMRILIMTAHIKAYEKLKIIPKCPHCKKALDTYEEPPDTAPIDANIELFLTYFNHGEVQTTHPVGKRVRFRAYYDKEYGMIMTKGYLIHGEHTREAMTPLTPDEISAGGEDVEAFARDAKEQ